MSRLSGWRRLVPRVYGTALAIVAAFCAIEAFSSAFRNGARPVRDIIDAILIPANGNLAYAAFVGLLAAAAARRKRVAWRLMLAFLVLQILLGALLLVVAIVLPAADLVDNGRRLDRTQLITLSAVGLAVTVFLFAVL